jgi:FkbM family methyltransferase
MISTKFKTLVERLCGCRIYRGWYPRGTNLRFDLMRLVSGRRPNIVDVGANIGETSVEMASMFPSAQIHACEPVKETFLMLVENTRRHRQISSHQIAIGLNTGKGEIYLYEGTVNNSLRAAPGEASLGVQHVTLKSLDDFCLEQSLESVDYLKIDTEGSDLDVVMGAAGMFQQGRIKLVLAELGFSRSNQKHVPFADFLSVMQEKDMSLFGIYDQRREFNVSQVLRRADCLFVSNNASFPGLAASPDV